MRVSLGLIWATRIVAGPCAEHAWAVDRVLDGDTVALRVPNLPTPLDAAGLTLRIRFRAPSSTLGAALGVDCPESGHRARCAAEASAAAAATAFTRDRIASGGVLAVEVCGWDKYGLRTAGGRRPGARSDPVAASSGT